MKYLLIISCLLGVACDCAIEGKRSFGHSIIGHGVLLIDETTQGITGHQKELVETSIDLFFELQNQYFPSSLLSTPYSHTEIHVRDDLIPCRYNGYHCHGCSAVGYLSNGGPFIWVSTIDNCSLEYLITSQLDRLIPESLGYDYREYNLVEDNCGAQINRCALARRTYERTTVYNEFCNE